MDYKDIENGIKDIKKIKMTEAEKNNIYSSILEKINKPKVVESPWSFYTFIYSRSKLVYLVVIPLFIILSGAGVAFASNDSLPDSLLYPIKVNIVEPVYGALNVNLASKAKYESKLAQKRLAEAQIMASNGKLDKKTEEKINKLLTKHTEKLKDVINKSKITKEDVEEIDSLVDDFTVEMDSHAKALELISDDVSEKKERTNISNKARVEVQKIKDIYKDKKEKGDKEDEDKFDDIKKENINKFNDNRKDFNEDKIKKNSKKELENKDKEEDED